MDHTHSFSMLMRLRMLKLGVGKGRQAIKQLYRRVLQCYATVATERAGYVLYRALVYSSSSYGCATHSISIKYCGYRIGNTYAYMGDVHLWQSHNVHLLRY